MTDRIARACSDLQAALDTARAVWEVNGGNTCPCCGAVGREAEDGAAYDDGATLHDPECLFAVAAGIIDDLMQLPTTAAE